MNFSFLTMRALSRAFLAGLAALFLSGCVQYKYAPLTDALVIHFASRAATKAGIPLADYEPTPELALHGGTWSVVYHGKTPTVASAQVKGEKLLRIYVDNVTGVAWVLPQS